jgi:NADH:ubiquinone oxidoreductase subunit 2 (subunit N)
MIFFRDNFLLIQEYYFSVLLFNIFSYIFILINIFLMFFLFDLKYIKTLNDLKFFGNIPLITTSIVILLLSFAGIPPLLGFISKFFIFIFLVYKNNYLFIFMFVFSNMFIIYFYIQNLRFITSKNIKNNFFIKNNSIIINNVIIFYFSLFSYFNIFAIFYFEEIIIYFNMVSSFYNF